MKAGTNGRAPSGLNAAARFINSLASLSTVLAIRTMDPKAELKRVDRYGRARSLVTKGPTLVAALLLGVLMPELPLFSTLRLSFGLSGLVIEFILVVAASTPLMFLTLSVLDWLVQWAFRASWRRFAFVLPLNVGIVLWTDKQDGHEPDALYANALGTFPALVNKAWVGPSDWHKLFRVEKAELKTQLLRVQKVLLLRHTAVERVTISKALLRMAIGVHEKKTDYLFEALKELEKVRTDVAPPKRRSKEEIMGLVVPLIAALTSAVVSLLKIMGVFP